LYTIIFKNLKIIFKKMAKIIKFIAVSYFLIKGERLAGLKKKLNR